MCTNYMQSYNDLQHELEKAKETLVVLNDNIKRISGRSPKLIRDSRSNEIKRSDNEKGVQKFQKDSSSLKKKTKSVFKRLSSPATRHKDAELRPRLTSRVIRELPSRQEIVAAQCADSESRARNRRMFGSLLGTLHKFCQEESRLKQKEEKKAQIEKKLEEQELLERESLKKERETLFIDRKRKQIEIKRIESKMSRIKDYEIWEHSMIYLKKFIKTKAIPSIYYRPKVLTEKTEKLLSESIFDIDKIINKKKEDLKINLIELEENLQYQEHGSGEEINHNFHKSTDVFDSPIIPNVLASSICIIKERKCDPDSKENKIQNLAEPILSSTVIVVNH